MEDKLKTEPMISGWIKKPIVKNLGYFVLLANLAVGYATGIMLERGIPKDRIENLWKSGIRYTETKKKIPVINELIDFPTRPGRELTYLIYGKKQEK